MANRGWGSGKGRKPRAPRLLPRAPRGWGILTNPKKWAANKRYRMVRGQGCVVLIVAAAAVLVAVAAAVASLGGS